MSVVENINTSIKIIQNASMIYKQMISENENEIYRALSKTLTKERKGKKDVRDSERGGELSYFDS